MARNLRGRRAAARGLCTRRWGLPREHVVTDIAAEVRDILVFHLGAEEGRLKNDARLAEDLGADRLDLVEIAMSCEERFDIDIPNHIATRLATGGDAVRFIKAQLPGTMGPTTAAGPPPVPPPLELLFREASHPSPPPAPP